MPACMNGRDRCPGAGRADMQGVVVHGRARLGAPRGAKMLAQMSCRRVLRFLGYLAGFVALLGVVRVSATFAQEKLRGGEGLSEVKPAEVRDLFPAERIPFAAPPVFMMVSGVKCDLKGNIYMIYSSNPELLIGQANAISILPISMLSIESKSITQYQVPTIPDYQGVARLDFDVSAEGRVVALLTALDESAGKDKSRAAYFIAKFKDNGNLDSYSKLGDAPAGRIQPLRLAVFRDGSLLVRGTAVQGGEFKAFAAVLDRSGTFAADVKLSHDAKPVPLGAKADGGSGEEELGIGSSTSGGSPREAKQQLGEGKRKAEVSPVEAVGNGSMVSGPDGNIYLLSATDPARLYVISPAGEVVRQFEVPSPALGLTPSVMGMAGDDKVFIWYVHLAGSSGESDQVQSLISVLSPQTGEVVGVYRLAAGENDSNLAACAVSQYNFLAVGTTADRKHLQVTRYIPR